MQYTRNEAEAFREALARLAAIDAGIEQKKVTMLRIDAPDRRYAEEGNLVALVLSRDQLRQTILRLRLRAGHVQYS